MISTNTDEHYETSSQKLEKLFRLEIKLKRKELELKHLEVEFHQLKEKVQDRMIKEKQSGKINSKVSGSQSPEGNLSTDKFKNFRRSMRMKFRKSRNGSYNCE